jgi:hypothetical protein
MPYWWDAKPEERYWVEITYRPDLGADLRCPQTDEEGDDYWSYSLINAIEPGDIVFHYSGRSRAFVGASVAGGPVEARSIVWSSHSQRRRKPKTGAEVPRAGWWRPVYSFIKALSPLTLKALHDPGALAWVRSWLMAAKEDGRTAAPLFMYRPNEIRPQQGYLTKMPAEFVARFPQLGSLAAQLDGVSASLEPLAESTAPSVSTGTGPHFNPKNASDYVALLKGGIQRRTRGHEALVKFAGEALQELGAKVATQHPLDLVILEPLQVIVEAKTTRGRSVGFAIRGAVGQLHEYRHFIGPKSAHICVLLDSPPGPDFIAYVEDVLRLMLMWKQDEKLAAGPTTTALLAGERIAVS